MKVKLTTSNQDEFVGYKNVNLTSMEEIYDNSCFELYIDNNVLKLVHNSNFSEFMKTCCSKLRHSGTIYLHGVDINRVALSYIHRCITENDLSDIIGSSIGFYNCRLIENELKKNNIKIHSMSISNNSFVVRGIRD